MTIFFKYSGAGNDFILIEDFEERFPLQQIPAICHCVGADGLILIHRSKVADARMRYFNSDGSSASLCGNGLRCTALHLFENSSSLSIETDSGVLTVKRQEGKIFTHLGKPIPICFDLPLSLLGTDWIGFGVRVGVPHLIFFVSDVNQVDVEKWGALARFHPHFAPEGVNVNFVQKIEPNVLKVRTYERGVEAETLACGTGVAASAVVARERWPGVGTLRMIVHSGDCLEVEIGEEISLSGPAQLLFHGVWDGVSTKRSC